MTAGESDIIVTTKGDTTEVQALPTIRRAPFGFIETTVNAMVTIPGTPEMNSGTPTSYAVAVLESQTVRIVRGTVPPGFRIPYDH